MSSADNNLGGDEFDEPPKKVARHESDSEGRQQRPENVAEVSDTGRTTLFVRSTQIHSRGELVNGFLHEHRKTLGIQSWYAAEGDASSSSGADNNRDTTAALTLRSDAPLECVFVKTSRKPYFLLEVTTSGEDVATAAEVAEKLTALHNTTYKDHPVHVEVAKNGLTVAAERKKLEMRDAVKRASAASTSTSKTNTTPTGIAASRPSTATTAFVPRVLRKK
ncbi:hypothetical protein DQ04_05361010 [Trypanosoma grayi]|uniref:hypothetical protein n=1 Tax=Trypanosoma grayi TaxID=71804 RepID=UPI0004F4231A|nr:hypothetical protein DQ04_05361010 [Trypanosoma grayi]KEG09353.1 hypothetical protein DQ04_05361010 [Trypanosoma grayi]